MHRFIYICLFVFAISFIFCQRNADERRKIKLSQNGDSGDLSGQTSTTIRLDSQDRRSIAVLFFDNLTGDANLEWLRTGLTEMFIRTLSQSRSLSVLSTERLIEIITRLEQLQANKQEIDMDLAAVVAREANVEAILTGNVSRRGDSLRIHVRIHDANQGIVIKEESIEGPGLEKIFSMVDDLTQHIRKDLHLSLDREEPSPSIAELSTPSLEAWRSYTTGLNYANKLLIDKAIEEFQCAVDLDSNFVAAHYQLYLTYQAYGDPDKRAKLLQKLLSLRTQASPQERFQIDLLNASHLGDIHKVLDINRRWLERFPDDRDANFMMGSIFFNTQHFKQAIHYLERTLKIDPKYKLAVNLMGYAYANLGDFQKAVSAIKVYQQLAPDEPNPYDSMGEIYWHFGVFDEAEKLFRTALEKNPEFNASLAHIGLVKMDAGEFDQASDVYESYYNKSSSTAEKNRALFNLGIARWLMNDQSGAIQALQSTLTGASSRFNAIRQLVDFYQSSNNSVYVTTLLNEQYNELFEIASRATSLQPIIFDLALLSLYYHITPERTITLFEAKLDNPSFPQQLRMRFILTLLYGMTNTKEKIDAIRHGLKIEDQIHFFKELKQLSYNNMWRFYQFLNSEYYQEVEQGIQFYQRLIDASLSNQAQIQEMVFRLLQSDLYVKANQRRKAEEQWAKVGTPAENLWQIIGPFPNRNGFNYVFPPEKQHNRKTRSLTSKTNIVRRLHSDPIQDGYIDLTQLVPDPLMQVAYATIGIKSDVRQSVQIRLGTDEGVKLWLNGNKVWQYNDIRSAVFDDDIVDVTLNKGINTVLLKVINRIDNWGFYFRVTDEDGHGADRIQFVSLDTPLP